MAGQARSSLRSPRRSPAVRSVAAWLPAALVVPAVMAGAIRLSLPEETASELRPFAPIEVGTTWVYDVFDHGRPSGTRTRQVTGQAAIGVDLFDAVTLASSYTDYPGIGPLGDTVYLGLTDDSLDQHAVYSRHEHLVVDPPAPAYQLPLTTGASWSYDGVVGTAGLRYTAEVADVGDVEVGGRTFGDCPHIVTTLQWKYDGQKKFGPEETQEEWTCPGFGPVRSSQSAPAQGLELTEELREFHGEATDWYAEAPAAVDATPFPGDTLGLDAQRTNAVDGTLSADLAWSDGRSNRFDFPPVSDGRVMVLAERDGEVSTMDLTTGEMVWRVRLTGPVVTTPAIAGDRVLVADARKQLWALSLADGSARWVRGFGDIVSASPAVAGDRAVVATDDRTVTAVDLADSRTLWQARRTSVVGAAPAVDGDRVVVADRGGGVAAYSLDDGAQVWSRTLEGGLLAGPAVADGRVLVGDDSGLLYGLDASTGEVAWEQRTVNYPSQPFAVADGTLVSLGDDLRLEGYDTDTGEERWSHPVERTRAAPVVVGDQVVTVDDDGLVTTRSLDDGRVADSWHVPSPVAGGRLSVHGPLGLVADALVVNVDHDVPGHYSALYAYPVDAAGQRRGVSFETELLDAAGGAGGASVLAGGSLFVPGSDQALHRVTADGDVTTLFESEGLLPGVAVAGDIVLAQKDDELRAYRADASGSEPLWTYATVPGYPGQVPAASDDTVFVPQNQVGLAAVDLATGEQRWVAPQDFAIGTGPPLVLPDGDVVYGGGAVGRFDARTGKQEWSILDGVLFGNAAYDDGIVFGDVSRALSASGLTALDARTGEQLWLHEDGNLQIGVGPEAAEGVVVDVDSQGLVTAYDGRSGKELWHLAMRTPVGGHPMIRDGVVYLTEAGRKEDLFQREFRVSAHDLHTGRFLGSLQPPGSLFTIYPSVAASDGALLVPASYTKAAVMVLRPQVGEAP